MKPKREIEKGRGEREWKNSKKLRKVPPQSRYSEEEGMAEFPSPLERTVASALLLLSISPSPPSTYDFQFSSLLFSSLLWLFFQSLFLLCLLAVQTHFWRWMAVWGEKYWRKMLQRDVGVLWAFQLFLFHTHYIRCILPYSTAGTLTVLYFSLSPPAKA